MFIHKLSITTCATGYLVEDETDPDQFIPVGGFGEGQLLNALSFVRELIERDAADRAAEQAMFDAKARGENVVPGPGWKPPETQPPASAASEPLHTAVLAANGSGTTLVDLHGTDESVLIRWSDRTVHFHGQPATITRPIKTDREIVDEVNAVALTLLEQRGFRAAGINPRTYVSLERQNPRIREAWENAVAVYEQITGSEVSDALQAVLEEEEAATAPAVPAEPAP